jgi:hypothetical protein
LTVFVCLCSAKALAKFVLVAREPTARLFVFDMPFREEPFSGEGASVKAVSSGAPEEPATRTSQWRKT